MVKITKTSISKLESMYFCTDGHVETTNMVLKQCSTCGNPVDEAGFVESIPNFALGNKA